MLGGNFKGISRKLLEYFKEGQSVFFKGISKKFHVCFKNLLRYSKGLSRIFNGRWKIDAVVSKVFHGYQKSSQMFQGSFKGASVKFQGCFESVSRKLYRSLKGV